jgi:hypothetical protein
VNTLIAVRGVAKRGKSTSIKKAYELLKNAYPDAEIELGPKTKDITIIITINITKNGVTVKVKVGIESQGDRGDPDSRLVKSLKHFVEIGCKVIICATRTDGKTVEAVNKLTSHEIKWIEKKNEPHDQKQELANDSVANDIFALAKAALNA